MDKQQNVDPLPIKIGTRIKLYGKETTVTGFHGAFNEAFGKYETIIETTGRGDPFERSLDVIEVIGEASQLPPAGPVWVNGVSDRPKNPHEVIWRNRKTKMVYPDFHSVVDGRLIKFESTAGGRLISLAELEWLDETGSQQVFTREDMERAFAASCDLPDQQDVDAAFIDWFKTNYIAPKK